MIYCKGVRVDAVATTYMIISAVLEQDEGAFKFTMHKNMDPHPSGNIFGMYWKRIKPS